MECLPELNALGLPRAISGAFASVYQMHGSGKQFAVRCFLQNVPDLENRYAKISECLNSTNLKYTVPFEFIARGIKVGGKWYPILKMQWVHGQSLVESIKKHLHDKDALTYLLNEFRQMSSTLCSHGIAHGDFQHGNIIIEGRHLRLVDYDGMYVPALHGFGSRELGHRHYQHPQRNSRHFGAYLDNFAAWSIYTSLYCLIQDNRLWARLDAGDECLLFRYEDYQQPTQSIAFRYLEHHDSVVVREASRTLRALLSTSPESIPPLGEPIVDRDQLLDLEQPQLWLPGFANSPSGSTAQAEPNLRTAFRDSLAVTIAPPILRVVDEEQDDQKWYQTMPAEPQIPIRRVRPYSPTYTLPPPASPPAKKTFPPLQPGWGAMALVWGLLITMIGGNLMYNATHNVGSVVPGQIMESAAQTVNRLPDAPNNFRGPQKLAFRKPSSGPNWFEEGRTLFLNKKYFEAARAFTVARDAKATSFMERAQCTYQLGRCKMKMGEYNLALSDFEAAREGFEDQNKFVPSLFVDCAEAQIQLQRYSSAAHTLTQQLLLCRQYSLPPSYRNPAIAGLRRAALGLLSKQDDSGFAAYAGYLEQGNYGAAQSYADLRDVANKLEAKKKYEFAFKVREVSLQMLLNRPSTTKPPTPAELKSFKLETMQAMLRNRLKVGDSKAVNDIMHDIQALSAESQ